MIEFDIAIIGAGAAGTACAKRAVAVGLKTALIEIDKNEFGGTCLNRGCIPTKFFLNHSKTEKNWDILNAGNRKIVDSVKNGLLRFLETKGVKFFWGQASFQNKNTLKVNDEVVSAKNIIIAAGSSPKKILDHPKAIFAEDLFSGKTPPGNKPLIVGAGFIGLEFASLLNNLGKNVLVVEKEADILPFFDSYLSGRLRIALEKKGIKIETSADLNNYDLDSFDQIILAAGRTPSLSGLNLEPTGIILGKTGWIMANASSKTSVPGIYACRAITGKKQLAYAAEYQAEICIAGITGKTAKEDYAGMPECAFTVPQIAKVGILEEEAKQRNIEYKIIKSNFLKFSSSYVYGDLDGFIEILTGKNNEIIGAGIISNYAAELISLFSLCVKNNLPLEALRNCTFIHPTLSEIIPLVLKEN